MKITYTGRQVELAPAQLKKLQAHFAKMGKLLDGRQRGRSPRDFFPGTPSAPRRGHDNYYNHQLVGLGSNGDLFTAIHGAAEKLEKQVLKARTKFRDKKRMPRKDASELENGRRLPGKPSPPAVHKVNHHQKRKPMTLDEAVLEMDKSRDYMVYRDAQTGGRLFWSAARTAISTWWKAEPRRCRVKPLPPRTAPESGAPETGIGGHYRPERIG